MFPAVRVKFRGRAKTAWTESESYYDSASKKSKTRSVHYSAEEAYMDAEYNLVQGYFLFKHNYKALKHHENF